MNIKVTAFTESEKWSNTDELVSDEAKWSNEQDPYCFQLWLKIHAYNWNDTGQPDRKLEKSIVHKIFSRTNGDPRRRFFYPCLTLMKDFYSCTPDKDIWDFTLV